MRSRFPMLRLCLQVYVAIAGVQVAYASCRRDIGIGSSNGQAMAQGKTAVMSGSDGQNVAAGIDQSIGQGNNLGSAQSATGSGQAMDQHDSMATGQGAAGQGSSQDPAVGQVAAAIGNGAIQAAVVQILQLNGVDQSVASAVVGATPPSNAAMPVTGPPNHAVMPVSGPPNHAVVPVSGPPNHAVVPMAGSQGTAGAPKAGSQANPIMAASCKSCQCNCAASFGAMVNQAVMMEASAAPIQSTMATIGTSISVAQNNAQAAATSETIPSLSIVTPQATKPTSSAAVVSTTVSASDNSTSMASPSTAATSVEASSSVTSTAMSSVEAASSIPSATVPLPQVTPAQNNVAQNVATPLASTAEAVTAGGAPIPAISNLSTFQFQSAVTVPLKVRRVKPTAALR